MGIPNLLPFVKKACREGHVKEFGGQSVAVDVSCLLHRGLFGCALKVAKGQDTDSYIQYVKNYVKLLRDCNCHVILVFDGQPLPAKKLINDSRRESRDQCRMEGLKLLSEGKESAALEYLQRSSSLTMDIIQKTIGAFRNQDLVDILVAPYESDAQLTYLNNVGLANVLVTEDSDLIPFGCDQVVFKLKLDGSCTIYERKNLPVCFGMRMRVNFDFAKFRRICILAGCDYLQNGLPGIGIVKATNFFEKVSGTNLIQVLPRIPRYLNSNSIRVKQKFIDDFIRAENTFLFQIVYDPVKRIQRPLTSHSIETQCCHASESDQEDFVSDETVSLPGDVNYVYAGSILSPSKALRLALGNELTTDPSDDKFTLPDSTPAWSIWKKKARKRTIDDVMLDHQHSKRPALGETDCDRDQEELVASSALIDTTVKNSLGARILCEESDFVLPRTSTVDKNKAAKLSTSCEKSVTDKEKREKHMSHSQPLKRILNGAIMDWNCEEILRSVNSKNQVPTVDDYASKSEPTEGSSKVTEFFNEGVCASAECTPVKRTQSVLSRYFASRGRPASGLTRGYSTNPQATNQSAPVYVDEIGNSPNGNQVPREKVVIDYSSPQTRLDFKRGNTAPCRVSGLRRTISKGS